MEAQLYLTSLQAVSILQLHNMVNGGGSCSSFHYRKNYAENLSNILKNSTMAFFFIFLHFCEGVKGRVFIDFISVPLSKTYFLFKNNLYSPFIF